MNSEPSGAISAEDESGVEFRANRDYYLEDGLVVLTESFLASRKRCCRLECRHCPWGRGPRGTVARPRTTQLD